MKKHILVACGFGSVTSRTIAVKLEKFFKQKKIDYDIDTCRVHELKAKVSLTNYDLIVSSTPVPESGIPHILATALLTGVGEDKVYDKILEVLNI